MKKLLVTLTAVLVSASTFAQGTVFFNNRTSAGDVRIFAPDGVSGAGTAAASVSAQLFLVPAGGGALVPLSPATTFRTSAAASFFVNPVDVTVPGIAAGESATLIIRAWDTAAGSFEASLLQGESEALTITGLGGVNPTTGAIVPTPDLAGLQSFTLTLIPEPSTMALGILGAAALLYRRRK
jgi:hypothetical protein